MSRVWNGIGEALLFYIRIPLWNTVSIMELRSILNG